MKYNLARMQALKKPPFCCKRRSVSGTGQSDCTTIPQIFLGCVGVIVACTANINQGLGIFIESMGVVRDVIYATGENGRIVVDFEDYRGKDLASLLRKVETTGSCSRVDCNGAIPSHVLSRGSHCSSHLDV